MVVSDPAMKKAVLSEIPNMTSTKKLSPPKNHSQPPVTEKSNSDEALENLYHKSMDRGLSFLSFISRSSTSPTNCSKMSSGIFCRICHDGEATERLISPCMCSGSMALVHRTCIEKWLSTANHDNCELCHHKYLIEKHPRPFVNWLCEPGVEDDQRNLVGDIVCFFLLTPLAAISTYLCATGAAFYLEEKKSESIGLICLCVVLVLIYMVWVILTIKYHLQVWFIWRENHQEIRLIEVGKEPVSRTQWRNPYGGIDYQTVTEESSSTDSASGTSLPDDKLSTKPANNSFHPSPSNSCRQHQEHQQHRQHQDHQQLEAATANLDISSLSVSRYSINDIESSLQKDTEDNQEHGRSYVIPPSPPAPPGTPVLGSHPADGSDIVSVRINTPQPTNYYVIRDEQVSNYTTFGKEAKSDFAARARNMSTLSQDANIAPKDETRLCPV